MLKRSVVENLKAIDLEGEKSDANVGNFLERFLFC